MKKIKQNASKLNSSIKKSKSDQIRDSDSNKSIALDDNDKTDR